MVIIPQLIKQDTWFAIRAFHYRQITATITAKSLSIVLESLRHLHRHSAIISSIIYTFFRDKNKKTPTSQLGGLLQRYFMMEFQIS